MRALFVPFSKPADNEEKTAITQKLYLSDYYVNFGKVIGQDILDAAIAVSVAEKSGQNTTQALEKLAILLNYLISLPVGEQRVKLLNTILENFHDESRPEAILIKHAIALIDALFTGTLGKATASALPFKDVNPDLIFDAAWVLRDEDDHITLVKQAAQSHSLKANLYLCKLCLSKMTALPSDADAIKENFVDQIVSCMDVLHRTYLDYQFLKDLTKNDLLYHTVHQKLSDEDWENLFKYTDELYQHIKKLPEKFHNAQSDLRGRLLDNFLLLKRIPINALPILRDMKQTETAVHRVNNLLLTYHKQNPNCRDLEDVSQMVEKQQDKEAEAFLVNSAERDHPYACLALEKLYFKASLIAARDKKDTLANQHREWGIHYLTRACLKLDSKEKEGAVSQLSKYFSDADSVKDKPKCEGFAKTWHAKLQKTYPVHAGEFKEVNFHLVRSGDNEGLKSAVIVFQRKDKIHLALLLQFVIVVLDLLNGNTLENSKEYQAHLKMAEKLKSDQQKIKVFYQRIFFGMTNLEKPTRSVGDILLYLLTRVETELLNKFVEDSYAVLGLEKQRSPQETLFRIINQHLTRKALIFETSLKQPDLVESLRPPARPERPRFSISAPSQSPSITQSKPHTEHKGAVDSKGEHNRDRETLKEKPPTKSPAAVPTLLAKKPTEGIAGVRERASTMAAHSSLGNPRDGGVKRSGSIHTTAAPNPANTPGRSSGSVLSLAKKFEMPKSSTSTMVEKGVFVRAKVSITGDLRSLMEQEKVMQCQ